MRVMKLFQGLFLAVVISGIFSLRPGPAYAQSKGEVCTLGKPAKLFKRPQGKGFNAKFRAGDVVTLLKKKRMRWLVEHVDGRRGFLNEHWMKKVCAFSQPEPSPPTQADTLPIAASSPKKEKRAERTPPPAESAPEAPQEPAKVSPKENFPAPSPALTPNDSTPSPPEPDSRVTNKIERNALKRTTETQSKEHTNEPTDLDKAADNDPPTAVTEQTLYSKVSLPTYVSAVMGTVAFGVAGYYALQMQRSADEAKAYGVGSQHAAADAEAYASNATIALSVGGAALAAGLYFLMDSILEDPKSANEASESLPVVTGSVLPLISTDGRPSLHIRGGIEW